MWRTVEDVEGNWDAPCYVVKVLVPGSVEAPVHELLASDGLAHAHIIPAKVVRDERSDFLLMPALLDPFAIPRQWDTEEVLDFCHQVLQVRGSLTVLSPFTCDNSRLAYARASKTSTRSRSRILYVRPPACMPAMF